ncbi:MAG: VOC family protein [Methyloligellaceae bacterium]
MTQLIDAQIDHFVVAATTLEQGVNYLQSQLNITIRYGGSHPKMGTHNHLMSLGDTFLEVIAVDPETKQTRTPRWYNLDNPEMQQQLAKSPKLITWVARTTDIEQAIKQTNIPVGKVETVSRGNLTWKITVPEDGSLPEQGIFPTLIQWPHTVRPWETMQNMGYKFTELNRIHFKPDLIKNELQNIGLNCKKIKIEAGRTPNLSLALENAESQQKIIK